MMTLTRKADYALIAMAYLGQLRRAAHGPVSARQIAERFSLPSPLLSNVLKELAQAKLVSSTRGATGGYELSADPVRTTVLEIITAVEGPIQFATCADAGEGLNIVGQGCSIAGKCPIRSPIQTLHHRIAGMLDEMTLEELVQEEKQVAGGLCECHTPQRLED